MKPVKTPCKTRENPVQTRDIGQHTSGIGRNTGYGQPVRNPCETRALHVQTREKNMGLSNGFQSVFFQKKQGIHQAIWFFQVL